MTAKPAPFDAVEIVQRIAEGDAQAESQFVRHYSRGLMFLLTRRARDPELAKDLHQETFIVVLQRLRNEGLRDPSKLSAFLRSTALNLLIYERRKAARRKTDANTERVVQWADEAQQSDLLEQREVRRLSEQVLGQIRVERDREILRRYYLMEEDKASICVSLDLKSAHFDRVLYRAKQRIRQTLADADSDRSSAGNSQKAGASS